MSVPPFSVVGIDHIVLRVENLARSLGFYRDVLGCAIEREQPELGLTQLRAGSGLIDLVTLGGPLGRAAGGAGLTGRNVDHFCLTLTPFSERRLAAYLSAQGITAGAPEARYGAEGVGPSFYVEDPDGNRVELKGARQGGRGLRKLRPGTARRGKRRRRGKRES